MNEAREDRSVALLGGGRIHRLAGILQHAGNGQKPVGTRHADPFHGGEPACGGNDQRERLFVQREARPLGPALPLQREEAAAARKALAGGAPDIRLEVIEARRQTQPDLQSPAIDALQLPEELRARGLE